MSRAFKAQQVVRCPLCYDGGKPAHVGYSVFVCECCGNRYRVVMATKGNTGSRLGDYVKREVRFK